MNGLVETDVCANCGKVTWFGQMHACRPRTQTTPHYYGDPMSDTSDRTGRQDGEVSREEMIADLRNCGWAEEDLQALPDFSAS